MTREQGDRRVRRSRQALHEALRSLILEKGYDRVRVQDIIDRADVGRATFYAHFRDKEDLLMSGFDEMRKSLRQYLAAKPYIEGSQSGEGLWFLPALFEHAASHRKEYRAHAGSRSGGTIITLVHKELIALIRAHIEAAAARRPVKPAIPVEFATQYLARALLAVLTWWLDNNAPYTPQQMARMFEVLTRPAAVAGLNLS